MAGYTRQDTTGQLANGNPIDADIFNDEYDAIEGAFNASSGHSHDGSAGGGAPIEDVGPSQELKVDSTAVFPKVDNIVNSGKPALRWRNGYFGTDVQVGNDLTVTNDASVGNDLTVTNNALVGVDATIGNDASVGNDLAVTNNTRVGNDLTVTGNTVLNGNVDIGDASTDTVTFTAQLDSDIIPATTGTYNLGNSGLEWNNIYVDGFAIIDNLTVDENATIAGTLDVTGDTNFDATTSSTSATTGAVVVDGGVGIAENLHVGGTLNVTGVTTLVDLDVTTLDVLGAAGIDGNFDIGTTMFTVDATNGNTTIAGTLGVTGDTTVANLTVNGNTILGDFNTDTVTINTSATTHSLIPSTTSLYTLGDASTNFAHLYVDDITAAYDINVAGDVVITGDLTVQGTTTTVNSTTVDIADLNITLASNATTPTAANGGGITVAGAAATMTYDSVNDRWAMNKDLAVANVYADIKASDGTTVFTAGNGVTAATFTGDVDGIIGGTTPAAVTATTVEFGTGLTDGTITITGFADEDDMVSDSSTLIPTQQSVKAYVDNATAGGGNINAATVTATSLDLGAGTGWVIQPSGTELHFIYNGAVQAKLTSTGTFQVNDDVTAEAF